MQKFHAIAALRGDGLRPELQALFDRIASDPRSELVRTDDGMLQAGPNPAGEEDAARKRSHASGGTPRERTSCQAAEDSATKVSCGTSSLPLVSGLNSRVTTNTTAAPVVVTSMGTVKPSG